MFMGIARVASKRSTCYRLNVGAVLVKDRNVIAIGYNGAPPKAEHCGGSTCAWFNGTACAVIHAEENALKRATELEVRDAELYVTHSPCSKCAELIIDRGLSAVYFEALYRLTGPVEKLIDHHVSVYQVLPSGYLINQRTKEVEV